MVEGSGVPFKITKDFIKILGVNVGGNAKEARDATWSGVLTKSNKCYSFGD